MSVWAAKLARVASAEGEKDVDILQNHRAYVLLAEAAAILREGSSASHRAQAAENIMTACSERSLWSVMKSPWNSLAPSTQVPLLPPPPTSGRLGRRPPPWRHNSMPSRSC